MMQIEKSGQSEQVTIEGLFEAFRETYVEVETFAVHRAAGRLAVQGWEGLAAQVILDQWESRTRAET